MTEPNIFDSFEGGGEPETNLFDSMAPETSKKMAPVAAIRNKAAALAMLKGGDPIANFRDVIASTEQGDNAVMSQYEQQVKQSAKDRDFTGVYSVLSDPTVPFEQKKQAINSLQAPSPINDTNGILMSQALAAESKGENSEEEKARMALVGNMEANLLARREIQNKINEFLITRHSDRAKGTWEATKGEVGPGMGSEIAARMSNKGVWGKIVDFWLPGSAMQERQQQLIEMEPREAAAAITSIIDELKDLDGFLIDEDDSYNKLQYLQEVASGEVLSTPEKVLMNLDPWLSVLGLGASKALRSGKISLRNLAAERAKKGIDATVDAVKGAATPAIENAVKTVSRAPDESLLSKATLPDPQELKLAGLKEERVQLRKDLRAAETNNKASISQRIEELDKKIRELKRGKEAPSEMDSAIKAVLLNQTVRMDLPSSVGNVVAAANPSMARSLFKAVVDSPDDMLAKSIYGTSKADVLVANLAPQIESVDGAVVTKVPEINRTVKPTFAAEEILEGSDNLQFTDKEIETARANIRTKFTSTGLVPNDAMGGLKFTEEGELVTVSGVYGTPEGGFSSVEEAISQTKYLMRELGVTEKNIEVLEANGITHRPADVSKAAGKEGNYYVRVNVPYQVTLDDVGTPEWLDVKLNILDRLPMTLSKDSGQASRWALDAASMLHPTLTGAAVRAEDLGAGMTAVLVEEVKEFTDIYDKLPKARQAKMQDYLKRKNLEGTPDNPMELAAEFDPNEIDAIGKFRKFWDTHFFLENRSVVVSWRNEGYKVIDTANTKMYARPVHENFRRQISRVYDPSTGKVVNQSVTDADGLYSLGGYYAKLRRPEKIDGVDVEHIMIRNTPQEYMRSLNDTDQVLNKRDGYFQLYYKAPKFVDVVKKDAKGGVVSRRTVAVANDTGEAEGFAKKLNLDPGEEYQIRSDKNAVRAGSDEWYDLNSTGGRMATRHRGAPLNPAGSVTHLGDADYIVNPIDSAVRAAKSIGTHSAMRPIIETMKRRALEQYWEVMPKNSIGGRAYPSDFNQIGEVGADSKLLADARTTWGYIWFLENGYLNQADNLYKTVMGLTSDMLGAKGFYKLERAAVSAQQKSPAGVAKGAVFKAAIAAHPIRQFLLQMHQSSRMSVYLLNPMAIKEAVGHFSDYLKGSLFNVNTEFRKFVKESGMMEAITQQNLIRETSEVALDHSQKILRGANAPFDWLRNIGFVNGEKFSTLGHLSAVYTKYRRDGKDLADLRVRAQAYSEARALMGDMNRAGDMPYNQNWASVVLQFMQVPHKMFLQATNRRIPAKERAKLVAGDLMFFGLPVWAVQNSFTEEMIPDAELRAKLIDGAESSIVNWFLQDLFESEYSVDLSSLAPNDMSGWRAWLETLWSEGNDDVLANSPVGRLLGQNGRVAHAFHMLGRYFQPFIDETATPVEFMTVATEIAKISSGFSDYQKAMLIKQFGEIRDANGNLIQGGVPEYAAWFQLFGLGSRDVKWMYETIKAENKRKKSKTEELRQVYNETKKFYSAMEEGGMEDARQATMITGAMLNIYKDDIEARKQIMSWVRSDMLGADFNLANKLIKSAGVIDEGERRRIIEMAPIDSNLKQQLIENSNQWSIHHNKEEE